MTDLTSQIAASAPQPGASAPHRAPHPIAISNWLFSVAAMIFVMVVVGGITRLTESGLSIVEWKPITGAIPPLTEQAWQEAFEGYKKIPEYTELNRGMTLEAFKHIYFWEYLHRLLGRLIGIAFALPLLWFWVKGAIPQGYKGRLLGLLALGGMQGVVGWWMVSSGLSVRTDVSHLRLAVHLTLALIIMAALVWTALDIRVGRAKVTRLGAATLLALLIQLLLGAFVAGLNAGYAYDTWPLMGDSLFPEGVQWLKPLWTNFVDNPIVVQFVHRWWAFVVLAAVIVIARRAKKMGNRRASIAIHSAVGTQILLGIATLMTGVNLHVAVTHQAVGALLVITTTWCAHVVGRPALVSRA